MINKAYNLIKDHHKSLNIPYTPQTSVISPLFQGQFNYCLDEIHWYKKYKHFTKINEEEHFQKIMPAIRLADYKKYYTANAPSPDHLAIFTISTLSGAHIGTAEQYEYYLDYAIKNMIDFLTKKAGLSIEKLKVSYFGGGMTPKEIEQSRKNEKQTLFILANKKIPADNLSPLLWKKYGLKNEQLLVDYSRDTFLTNNWYLCRGPWGYRNEIYYQLQNGHYLDIATIEFLKYTPIVEYRDGKSYCLSYKPWKQSLIIDGLGVERLALAKSDLNDIYDLPDYHKLLKLAKSKEIEAIRILHRVYTDSKGEKINSRQRKDKLKKLIRKINNLSIEEIKEILTENEKIYSNIFPELQTGTDLTLSAIKKYRLKIK